MIKCTHMKDTHTWMYIYMFAQKIWRTHRSHQVTSRPVDYAIGWKNYTFF